jgi:dTDP-4-dehydrorhamnose 3,5-epimerase
MKLVRPRRISDDRGWFAETYNEPRYVELGIDANFRQDNYVYSRQANVLRGLHFQKPPHAQAKLVSCVRGRIWDVAVDIRVGSPTFGAWKGVELTPEDGLQAYLPVGFAHGYLTREPNSEVTYKVSDFYAPQCEGGMIWNDPAVGIRWPLGEGTPLLSPKDEILPTLALLASPFVYDSAAFGPLETD